MRKVAVFTLLCLVLGGAATTEAEGFLDAVKRGNAAYKKQEYQAARDQYNQAEADLPESAELQFNQGTVLYAQGRYEEALEKFDDALLTADYNVEAATHYNMGNTLFKMGDYPKAIESYQNALEINPEDMDAKFNLELARKMLKEHMQPENKDQNEEKQQKQDKQQEQDQHDQEQQNQQDQQNQEQQQQQQQERKPISKEDAERILNALRDDEQELQKKIRRAKGSGDYVGKDW
jgi:tetratricopeptide (TPR) repeat protein